MRYKEIREDWEAWQRSEDYVLLKKLVANIPELLDVAEAAAEVNVLWIHGLEDGDRHPDLSGALVEMLLASRALEEANDAVER